MALAEDPDGVAVEMEGVVPLVEILDDEVDCFDAGVLYGEVGL